MSNLHSKSIAACFLNKPYGTAPKGMDIWVMYVYPRLAGNNCEAELLLQSQFKASLLHEPFTHHPKPPSSRDCTYTTDTHLTTQLLPNSFFNFYFATRSSICNLSTSVPKLLRLLACGRGLLYISSNYKNKL